MTRLFKAPQGEDDKHAYHTPLETKVKEILSPFQEYIASQITASFLLLVCTIIAIVWASLPNLSQWYTALTQLALGLHLGSIHLVMPLKFWVNDVLLTLFFFFVGLEIKREFLVGELTNPKQAVYVIVAAIGGMSIPPLIYLLFNHDTSTVSGWGIPMATDTAFALGIMSCFRRLLPKGLFSFMAALAIIDDIGAIIVIAVFYTTDLNVVLLLPILLLVTVLCLMNYAGFRKPWPYLIIGLIIWGLIESAGIHGTIAGILVAFLIPARPHYGPRRFIRKTRELLDDFENHRTAKPRVLEDDKQHEVLEEVQQIAQEATTPLQRWESRLELPVALVILPLFALINAGIALRPSLLPELLHNSVALGILLGLLVGKPIGIILFSQLATWCKFGIPPMGVSRSHISIAGLLAGVGFTMSLFIANLSFADHETILLAKAAILFGSLLAAAIGLISILTFGTKMKPNKQ